jgi:hypothetical protein
MRTNKQWLDYRTLELITAQPTRSPSRSQAVLSVLSSIWEWILIVLMNDTQPRIWQTIDCAGQLQWTVYDPKTKRSIQLASEEALRSWLDENLFVQHNPISDLRSHPSLYLVNPRY